MQYLHLCTGCMLLTVVLLYTALRTSLVRVALLPWTQGTVARAVELRTSKSSVADARQVRHLTDTLMVAAAAFSLPLIWIALPVSESLYLWHYELYQLMEYWLKWVVCCSYTLQNWFVASENYY